MSARRILFVQYTEPAAYPPLEHSAQLLARAGCDVLFIGIRAREVEGMRLRSHERIRAEKVDLEPGGRMGILNYVRFTARSLLIARRFRPDWIYASDALSAAAAVSIRKLTGAKLLYHEHDAVTGRVRAAVRWAHRSVAQSADIVVVPGAARVLLLPAPPRRVFTVWNCPLRDEVAHGNPIPGAVTRLAYAGSINEKRLPMTFIDAIAQLSGLTLDIIGYTTIGAPDYVSHLMARAAQLGVGDRVRYHGVVPERKALLDLLSFCHIGIATLDISSGDQNLHAMAGPSNKPFDYMARGLPFLVSRNAEWVRMYVEPGYAAACDPLDVRSITNALIPLMDPGVREAMGTNARARIAGDWNYDRQFAPVLSELTA